MRDTQIMNHNSFILSPITDILKDVTSASLGIGSGIETYPLCDYVMQSLFLKMTGSQEQKMKCICWELATNDYEYRYFRFTQKQLGECSNYNDKKDIYKDLVKQIEKYGSTLFNENFVNRNDILIKTNLSIEESFSNSNLLIWAQNSFDDYINIWNEVSENHFAINKNNLFVNKANLPNSVYGKSLIEMYENNLYKHRNRVSHNTLSYQQNLPTLSTLVNEDYKYENYFVYFSILILIDNIFISLYKRYLQNVEDF